MSVVGRKLKAEVEVSESCPLFKEADAMVLDLPELVADDCDAACAVALADLLPSALKLVAGGAPPSTLLACRGCRAGKARAYFRMEVLQTRRDDAARSALLPTLSKIPLFKVLPERQLEKIVPLVAILDCDDGHELVRHGDPGRAFFIVVEGQVEIQIPGERGELSSIGILSEGECFGEMSLLTGDPCSATIQAKGSVKVLNITKADFLRLLSRLPLLNVDLSRLLALRLRQTSAKLVADLQEEHDIEGELSTLSLGAIVQAIETTGRSGRLELTEDAESFAVVFRGGRVVRLETPLSPPEEGFYQALNWTRGQFAFSGDDSGEAVEQNVFMDATGLLLEGMRRMDEAAEGAGAA